MHGHKFGIVAFAFFLLLVGMSNAQLVAPQEFKKAIIVPEQAENQFHVSLFVFEQSKDYRVPTAEQQKKWIEECSKKLDPSGCLVEKSLEYMKSQDYSYTYKSVNGANFTFYYLDPLSGYQPLKSCGPNGVVTADKAKKIWSSDFKTQTDFYYASCTIPKSEYTGKRLRLWIVAHPQSNPGLNLEEASYTVELFNPDSTILDSFVSTVATALKPTNKNFEACLPMFIILGLFLASMYFAGKSPVSLLDITTPRLPTPKTFAAGGQILAPFGYTEMKRTIKQKWAAAGKVFGQEFALLAGASKGSIERAAASIGNKLSIGKDLSLTGTMSGKLLGAGDIDVTRNFFKAFSAEALRAGVPWATIRRFAKHTYEFTEADHRDIRNILGTIRGLGGRHAIMARMMDEHLQSVLLYKQLEVLTGHIDAEDGRRSVFHQMAQSALGKSFSPDRFSAVGPLLLGSHDSFRRTLRVARRGAVGIVTHGAGLVRDTVAQVVGPSRIEALRRRAAGGGRFARSAGAVAVALTKSIPTPSLGGMFPVHEKMRHFYNLLLQEGYRDTSRYLLKCIYRHYGINPAAFSEEELAHMGHVNMDPLALSGYHPSAALDQIEERIRQILTSGRSARERFEDLVSLAMAHGIHYDPRVMSFVYRLEAIEGGHEDAYAKLLSIHELFSQQHMRFTAASSGQHRNDDDWYPLIGRNGLHGSDAWEIMTLRRMIHDGEQQMLHGGIKEVIESGYLYMVNRLTTLDPMHKEGSGYNSLPEYMRNPAELRRINDRVKLYLYDLLTEEGRRVLGELTNNKPLSHLTVTDFMNVLYGAKYMHKMHGIEEDKMGAHVDPKTGRAIWWEEDAEHGPLQGWFKVDMKRHWLDRLDESSSFALGQWVHNRFERGYTSATNPALEAELMRNPMFGAWDGKQRREEFKRLWVRDQLDKDIANFTSSVYCNNAYVTTQQNMRFYMQTAAGFLLKALRDRGFDESHPDIQRLEQLDTNNPAHLREFRAMLTSLYAADFERVLRQPMHYDDIAKSKQVWVMMAEGGFAPYKKGMMLGDQDRPLNGVLAVRDGHGQLRHIDIDQIHIALPPHLQAEFGALSKVNNQHEWQPFLNRLHQWSEAEGFEAQKMFTAVLWRYSNQTHDYDSFWRQSRAELVCKREVAPVAPNWLGTFGESYGVVAKPVRNFMLNVCDYISKVSLTAGGSLLRSSYEVIATSEWHRQTSFRLSQHLFQQDFEAGLFDDIGDIGAKTKLKQAYREFMISHGQLHQVWDYAIDRHPGRQSTSYGSPQTFSSYFLMGPSKPFPIRQNLRAYLTRWEYVNFMAEYGWPMKIAAYPFQVFTNMMRGVQMAMQGYPNRFSVRTDPLRQYYHTNPRILEAIQAATNPFSFNWGGKKYATPDSYVGRAWSGISTTLQKLNIIKGSLEEHHLAGEVFQHGLKQHMSDINIMKMGMYSNARTGGVNPGVSHYNYRFAMELDQMMAEYLAFRMGRASAYYVADEYVRNQALTNTTRRTVAAEALAARRIQELQGFGLLANSIHGWSNPLLFLYHLPVPGFGFFSPREFFNTHLPSWRRKREEGVPFTESLKQIPRDAMRSIAVNAQFWRRHSIKYCECGMCGFAGSECKQCQSFIY